MEQEATRIDVNTTHKEFAHECSYSNTPKGSATCGFNCKSMTVMDYNDFMERGFRRCGEYYYKPNLFKSHWQWYTIRMDATKHTIRKSHNKAWKKWQKFLKGERDLKEEGSDDEEGMLGKRNPGGEIAEKEKEPKKEFIEEKKEDCEGIKQKLYSLIEPLVRAVMAEETKPEVVQEKVKSFEAVKTKITSIPDKKEIGVIFSNVLVLLKNISQIELPAIIKTISEKNLDLLAYKNYSTSITPAGIVRWLPEGYTAPNETEKEKKPKEALNKSVKSAKECKPRKFEIKLEKAECTQQNYEIYQRYCDEIHEKPEKSRKSYTNFLCLQSLKYKEVKSSTAPEILKLGCYHMNYYLDDVLIAVGVVDIVPKGLSSVYFFYEPKYKPLKLGIIAGLYEIEYIQKMQKVFPLFKYYYLGFFIIQTDKMNYKADFEPCELLCPKTNRFVELTPDRRKAILDKQIWLDPNPVTPEEKSEKEFENKKEILACLLDHTKIAIDDGQPVRFKGNKNLEDLAVRIVDHCQDVFNGMGKKLLKRVILTL